MKNGVDRGRRVERWAGLALAAVALAALVYTEAASLLHDDQALQARAPVALQGVACPHLREAFDHSRRGDVAAFSRSAATAATVGERALDVSGQEFGRPERLAIELASTEMTEREDRERLLEASREACAGLGLWGGA